MESTADEVVRVTLRNGDEVITVTVVAGDRPQPDRPRLRTPWTPRLRSALAERRFAEALEAGPSTPLTAGR